MNTGTAILLVAMIGLCVAICIISLRICWHAARARKLIAEICSLQSKEAQAAQPKNQ